MATGIFLVDSYIKQCITDSVWPVKQAAATSVTQPECHSILLLSMVTFHTLADVWKASSSVRSLFYNRHTLRFIPSQDSIPEYSSCICKFIKKRPITGIFFFF